MYHRITTTLTALGLLCLATACAAEPFAPDSDADAAQPAAPTTRGIIDLEHNGRPDDATQLIGDESSALVAESGGDRRWDFADGVLTVVQRAGSMITPTAYRDFRLHVEFNVNDSPSDNPEQNGNSGVYIQQRYEIQILNSHGIAEQDYKPSYCGSIYKFKQPDHIVCRPAGQWQTYDIAFRAARFDGDEKTEDARVTVYHNGTLIHDDVALPDKTGAGQPEGPNPRPLRLQAHGNPVEFRNCWVQELELD